MPSGEFDNQTGEGQGQVFLKEAISRWVGAGRYFGHLLPWLRQEIESGERDNLADLVGEFERSYERGRIKELKQEEERQGVQILGGGMLRFLPEAIGESEDKVDMELLRLARRQRLTGESEKELSVRLPRRLFRGMVETPPEGPIVEYIAQSEEGRELILDLREAGVRLLDSEEEAGEEIAFSFYGWLLGRQEVLRGERQNLVESGDKEGLVEFEGRPEVGVIEDLLGRLSEELKKSLGRIEETTGPIF